MRFAKAKVDGAEWFLSSPVYAGSAADVDKALHCLHGNWTKIFQDTREGHVSVTEKCGKCIAERIRFRKIAQA